MRHLKQEIRKEGTGCVCVDFPTLSCSTPALRGVSRCRESPVTWKIYSRIQGDWGRSRYPSGTSFSSNLSSEYSICYCGVSWEVFLGPAPDHPHLRPQVPTAPIFLLFFLWLLSQHPLHQICRLSYLFYSYFASSSKMQVQEFFCFIVLEILSQCLEGNVADTQSTFLEQTLSEYL